MATVLTFPAPVRKSSIFTQIPDLRPNNPIIRYSLSGQGGFWGGFLPFFWSKIAISAHILRPEFGGSKSGQKWPKMAKMGKNGQNGQKWPKMAFLGGPWVNPHPPPFCGSNLAWKPRFSPKGPFSRIFGGGRFWGGQKGSFLGFSGVFWGVKKWPQKGGPKWPKWSKRGFFGGFLGGVENGTFWGFPTKSPIKKWFFLKPKKTHFRMFLGFSKFKYFIYFNIYFL